MNLYDSDLFNIFETFSWALKFCISVLHIINKPLRSIALRHNFCSPYCTDSLSNHLPKHGHHFASVDETATECCGQRPQNTWVTGELIRDRRSTQLLVAKGLKIGHTNRDTPYAQSVRWPTWLHLYKKSQELWIHISFTLTALFIGLVQTWSNLAYKEARSPGVTRREVMWGHMIWTRN